MGNNRAILVILSAIFMQLPVALSTVWAKPATSQQAMTVVQAWRKTEAAPLKASLGTSVKEVQTFHDMAGTALYHVVYLEPSGFVIVPADDLVEPIIAFSPEGAYDASDANPLGALVSRDLPERIARVRGVSSGTTEKSGASTAEQAAALSKWERLQDTAAAAEYGIATVSDVRVAPLVQSKWNQSAVSGNYCYNYYTPNHYPSGCVATAMSQLMRFHQYPGSTVGTASFSISVDNVGRTTALMGGDGLGGAYNWAQMPLVPDGTTTDTQRQAIGRLLHDAGATVNMSYTSSGSGSDTLQTATALKTTYGYSNAVKGYSSGSNIPTDARNSMVNPNLDAGLPVLFGITDGSSGHAVVGDGYGYQSGTMYHHLNMGWSGSNDLWYNLPNIDDSSYGFTSVYKIVYNVYKSGTGEIISGRVADCTGAAISGVAITASRNGTVVATATTGNNGIYALKGLPSASTYTIAASKNGYGFTPQTVTTGTSSDYSAAPGNKWGVDFSQTQGCVYSVLTVAKAGAGSGTITSVPTGISCGSTCSSSFASPSTITLTATPNAGSIFSGWSGGGCSGTGTCIVSLTADTTITATFAQAITRLLETFDNVTPSVLPSGWQSTLASGAASWATHFGTSNPSGIASHSGSNLVFFNSFSAASGNSAVLVSPPFSLAGATNNNASFWMYRDSGYSSNTDRVEVYINSSASLTGATLLGTVNRCTSLAPVVGSPGWYNYMFAIPGSYNGTNNYLLLKGISAYGNDINIDDVTITGMQPLYSLSVTLSGNGSGNVTSSPSGIACQGGTCSSSFSSGTAVTLIPTASAGSTFSAWSGDCSGIGNCMLSMTSNHNATGTFSIVPNVRIGTTPYGTLGNACAAVGAGGAVEAKAMIFTENLTFDRNVSFLLLGGYANDFSSRGGYTVLDGILAVAAGSVTVDMLTIQ